ncbi:MAG TPA: putative Ig domain-containing protein, partial [Cellvibrio sp.]|nr:putative Ig domain-containing protein [Cellvibrio sp.]
TNTDVGIISIDVIADDGNGGSITDTFSITIGNANDAPTVANAIPDQNATEDMVFTFQFAANTFADVDAATTLNYVAQLAGGGALPAWLSFDAVTRTFSGTPANADVGTISIDVIASDGNGGSVTDTFNISITNTNDAPIIANAIPDQTATEDSAFTFQFAANTFADVDAGTTFTYVAQLAGGGALPAWLSFDATTRTFTGTPINADVGIISIDVIANDGNGGSITNTFSITIGNTNDAPTVNSPPVSLIAQEDSPFNFSFPLNTFNDADAGDSLSYSAQLANGQALPAWLQFNANTLAFSGTPANNDVGNLNIQLIASDGEASASFQFTIQVMQVNDAPVAVAPAVINSLEDATGNSLDLFSIFSDEETAANQLQYTVVSNSNPGLVTGTSINANNGQLTFTYGANQFGSSDLILRAQDANGAIVETSVRINIASVNDIPVSSGIADMRADSGSTPLQLDLRGIFSDIEDGTTLTYALIGNTNPAIASNIQWDQSTGVMTIAVATATGGETFITLRAQDSNGEWVDTQFRLTVTAPVIIPEQPGVPTTPVTPPPAPEVPVTPPVLPPAPPTDNQNPGPGNNGIDPSVPDNNLNIPVVPGQVVPGFVGQDDPRDDFNLPNDKSSRDYERIEAELESKNIPVTTLTASSSLVGLISTDVGFAPWEAADFDNEVRRIRAQMDMAMEEEQDRRAVVAGLTFSVTTGLLIWSLRASSLLLTLMSMLPLWRGLDPLPILDEVNKRKKELEQQRKDRAREDKSSKEVGYLFDHAQQKPSRR